MLLKLNERTCASYLNLFHATFTPNNISLLPFQLVTKLAPKINNEKKVNTHTNQQEETRKINFIRFMHYACFTVSQSPGHFYMIIYLCFTSTCVRVGTVTRNESSVGNNSNTNIICKVCVNASSMDKLTLNLYFFSTSTLYITPSH